MASELRPEIMVKTRAGGAAKKHDSRIKPDSSTADSNARDSGAADSGTA